MEQLYNLGSSWISSLSELADFLLSKPLDFMPLSRFMLLWEEADYPDWLIDILSNLHGASIASIIFGAGLTGIITLKIIRFIWDSLPVV